MSVLPLNSQFDIEILISVLWKCRSLKINDIDIKALCLGYKTDPVLKESYIVSTREVPLWTLNQRPVFQNYSFAQNNSAIYGIWLPPIRPKSPLHRVDSAKASDINAVLSRAYFLKQFLAVPSHSGYFSLLPELGMHPVFPEQASK